MRDRHLSRHIYLGVELVVAEIEGRVDGLERLEINVDLLLLSLGRDDGTAVDDETVGWHAVVQLEALLGGRDGSQDTQPIDATLDVAGSSELIT